MSDWVICSDFDGTICIPDSSDFLLSRFASAEWKALEDLTWAGKMTERESYPRQIALLNIPWSQARDALLKGVRIRPGFQEFVAWTQVQKIPFVILSSGLRPLIEELLHQAGVHDVRVESHDLRITDDHWEVVLHSGARLEEHCSHCKCAHLAAYRSDGRRVVYIGDGYTDLCPSRFADALFATGRLAEACEQSGLPFYPFKTFHDVRQRLDTLLYPIIQESPQ